MIVYFFYKLFDEFINELQNFSKVDLPKDK